MNQHFVIISPCYNVKDYIYKSIMSALRQTYTDYEYLVVEDASVDGTREIIQDMQKTLGGFKVHYNDTRLESPLGNFVKGIKLSPGDPEDVIVTLDSDDWFANNNVLAYLNEVYQDPDVWMTYGSFVSASGKITGMCKQLEDTRSYRRRTTWVTSHLRTIKRKLFDKIKDEDMRDGNGKYYVYYPDTAYMFPAIEMAGLKHSIFIPEILYIYNDRSPLCSAEDWKKRPVEQKEIYKIAREIRMKPIYGEVDSL